MAKQLNFLTSSHVYQYESELIMLINQLAVNEVNSPATTGVLNDKTQVSSVVVNAANALSKMEAERITWEQGAYRTSNQSLYAVLAQCLAFCGDLTVAEAKQRGVALESFFKQRGYKYNSDSPLASRVVKAVFGNIDRRRISTYSLVLRQAQKVKVTNSDLAQWIEDNGGIQEIRLSRSDTFVSPKQKAEIAKAAIENNTPIGFAKSELLSFVADADFVGNTCVLLAEQQADGSFGIKAVLRSQGLINAAYTTLYSKQNAILVAAQKEVDAANDADGAFTASKSA
jgi:hypothetical protein